MSMLKQSPCGSCDAAATETDTGAFYCRRSNTGDAECSTYVIACQIAEIAGQVAALIATVGDEKMRREIAESAADGFANALYEQGAGGRLNDAVFYQACNVHREKVAA